MKTLIIASYATERERLDFCEYFSDILSRDDVIFIADPDDVSDLRKKIKPYEGEYDRVVLATHGSRDKIPFMIIGSDKMPIHHVVKEINMGNDGSVKKIHLTACHIGTNFELIEKYGEKIYYYNALMQSLKVGQDLFLHGDSFTGDITTSFRGRLKGIVESKDYSTAENILDSDEAINVVVKRGGNLRGTEYLRSFSQPAFDFDNCEGSIDDIRSFLSEGIKDANSF